MRIVAGAWRGRSLKAPPGETTRPTADRVRQALFDMLLHAPWGGRGAIDGVRVLDGFAGTGALGLEALSRGAANATFLERDVAALAVLRSNITALRAQARCNVLTTDVLSAPPGAPCDLVFLDPPYGQDLVSRAVVHLARGGWIGPGALIVAETGHAEPLPSGEVLAAQLLGERQHGAARISFWHANA